MNLKDNLRFMTLRVDGHVSTLKKKKKGASIRTDPSDLSL
jgi:hypothetical protein